MLIDKDAMCPQIRGDHDCFESARAGQELSNGDIGAYIIQRGLCLPSDNKTTVEQQNLVIEIIRGALSDLGRTVKSGKRGEKSS